MLSSVFMVAVAAFTGLVSAQNYSTSGPLTVVADSVDINLRESWCTAQQNSCPMICGGAATPNQCDPNTLEWTCTCTSGISPNFTSYEQTIPFYECQQWVIDCVAAHPNDLDGQHGCQSVTCGTLMPQDASSSSNGTGTSSPSTTSAPTATSGSDTSSSSSAASTTSAAPSTSATHTSATTALKMGQSYGTGLVAAALLVIFAFAL